LIFLNEKVHYTIQLEQNNLNFLVSFVGKTEITNLSDLFVDKAEKIIIEVKQTWLLYFTSRKNTIILGAISLNENKFTSHSLKLTFF